MRETKNKEYYSIESKNVWRRIKERRTLFFIVLPIVFVGSFIVSGMFPMKYAGSTKMIFEQKDFKKVNMLNMLFVRYGYKLKARDKADDIGIWLYEDWFKSPEVVSDILNMYVSSPKTGDRITYYSYLKSQYENSFQFKIDSLLGNVIKEPSEIYLADAVRPTSEQVNVMETVRRNVTCFVDLKTYVISINVMDDDVNVCAELLTAVSQKLQTFIHEERTKKITHDLKTFEKVAEEAYSKYQKSKLEYEQYSDSHLDPATQEVASRKTQLEDQMLSDFNTYNAMNTRVELAKTKLQDSTPVFTILQKPSVPIEPVGLSKLIIMFGSVLVAFSLLLFYVLKDDIFHQLKA